MSNEPTVSELIVTGARGIKAEDKLADTLRGSDYESLVGPCAIIWSREAARDTDLFNATNFNTADDRDLTDLAYRRYGKVRTLDTRGTGYVELERAIAGTQETFFLGSHFTTSGGSSKTYRTTQEIVVPATDRTIRLPIEALEYSAASKIDVLRSTSIDDPVADAGWQVVRLVCAAGTAFELAPDFRARIRRERQEEREGHRAAIIKACKDAGADHVVLFQSDFAGTDMTTGSTSVTWALRAMSRPQSW